MLTATHHTAIEKSIFCIVLLLCFIKIETKASAFESMSSAEQSSWSLAAASATSAAILGTTCLYVAYKKRLVHRTVDFVRRAFAHAPKVGASATNDILPTLLANKCIPVCFHAGAPRDGFWQQR